MREVNKKDSKKEQEKVEIFSQKRKALSMLGFLISIVLLTIAIFLSMKQEKADRLARIENSETNITKIASSDISKNINEVKEKKNANKTDGAKENSTSSDSELNKETKQTSSSKDVKENSNEASSNSGKNSNKVTQNSNKNSTNLSDNSEKTNIEKTSVENNEENNNKDGNELSNFELEDDDIENANANVNVNASVKANVVVEKNVDSNDNAGEGSSTDDSFIKPCDGEIIRTYSMDSLVYSDTLQEWITHRGIDIKGEMYQEVRATQSGTIKSIKNDPRYGTSIIIEHKNGFKTVYSCLLGTRDGLEENQEVKQGAVIGKIGNSGVFETADGAHLHFEMLKDDEYVNPNIYIK